MKFCKDCKWFKKHGSDWFECISSKLDYIEPVFGEKLHRNLNCFECRQDFYDRCGPDADWFEARIA